MQISIHMYIRYIYRYFSRLDYVVSTTYISYEYNVEEKTSLRFIHDSRPTRISRIVSCIYMCKRYLPVTRKSSVGSSQVRETCRISLNTSMLFIGGEVTFRTDLAKRDARAYSPPDTSCVCKSIQMLARSTRRTFLVASVVFTVERQLLLETLYHLLRETRGVGLFSVGNV